VLEEFNSIPFLSFNPTSHTETAIVIKRGIDIFLALLLITLTAPFFVLIALAIKLTSPGPVFFKQERCGLNGRQFDILKFRTMVVNAEVLKSELGAFNEECPVTFGLKDERNLRLADFCGEI
jgi:lipopolysaccharide/colanic/teichoic acid biosynthesis glycosyltransferase